MKKSTPFKRVESISPLAEAVWENPRVGFLFLVAQLICLARCSALSDRKFSGEGKLIFEGVKVEIALVAFEPQPRAITI